MNKEIDTSLSNEDRIKDIAERFTELYGYCSVLYSAATNEADKPADSDLANSIYILLEQFENLKEDLQNYISFCEETGIFGHLHEVKSDK